MRIEFEEAICQYCDSPHKVKEAILENIKHFILAWTKLLKTFLFPNKRSRQSRESLSQIC